MCSAEPDHWWCPAIGRYRCCRCLSDSCFNCYRLGSGKRNDSGGIWNELAVDWMIAGRPWPVAGCKKNVNGVFILLIFFDLFFSFILFGFFIFFISFIFLIFFTFLTFLIFCRFYIFFTFVIFFVFFIFYIFFIFFVFFIF